MGSRMLACLFAFPYLALCADLPVLEGTAIWLEQVRGTTDVLVVGSWTMGAEGHAWGGIQGWSYGLCHDPAEASILGCEGAYGDPCECPGGEPGFCFPCSRVRCTEDMLTGPCSTGEPADFHTVGVEEGGITQGVALLGCIPGTEPEERFELLRISYEVFGDSAHISFCDTLGEPPVAICYVLWGTTYRPERVEGLTITARGQPFIRGDANSNGSVEIADAVFVVRYLFRGDRAPECPLAADANDDDELNLADGIAILYHLFRSAGPLPEPHGHCGLQPEPWLSRLVCPSFPPCR